MALIISASRRTDIPAFYAEWFMNRIRAGFCTVPNPFNRSQVAQVSLRPEDVDVFVFWTRNPRPLLPHLAELDERGYRYYFQYTLMDNPRQIDAHSPPAKAALQAFAELAGQVGPQRVIWRYDPIVFTALTPPEFHSETYARLAEALRGCTARSVISLFDPYPKARKRLEAMAQQGAPLLPCDPAEPWFGPFIGGLAQVAAQNGMQIVSCAEELDLRPYGVRPGKCVDDEYICRVFGLDVIHKKDPGQRKACGCVVSKDIGAYDTCLFGCTYCYATTSFDRARRRHQAHDPHAPSLIPHAGPQGETEPTGIRIRPTQPGDIDRLCRWMDAFGAADHASYTGMQSRGEGIYLIAWEEHLPVACLFIRWTGNSEVPRIVDRYPQAAQFAGCPEICDVYVVRQRRSQGIGTQLLRRALQLAAERGASQVTLCVDTDNPRARLLYERLGFVEPGIGPFTTSGVLVDETGRERPWQNGPQVMLVKKLGNG